MDKPMIILISRFAVSFDAISLTYIDIVDRFEVSAAESGYNSPIRGALYG